MVICNWGSWVNETIITYTEEITEKFYRSYYHLKQGIAIKTACCAFAKEETRQRLASCTTLWAWLCIHCNNIFEVLLTLTASIVITVLSIFFWSLCCVGVVLLGVTTGLEFSVGSTTNRQIFIFCFIWVRCLFASYLYFPFYILLNVIQIPFPYIMLNVLNYDKWFTENPVSEQKPPEELIVNSV